MSSLYRKRGVYYVAGRDMHSKRWQRSTRQRDRRAAEIVRRQLEVRFAISAADNPSDKLTLVKALELRAAQLERAGRAKATKEIHETKGRHLVRVFGASRRVGDLNIADTTAYVDLRLREGASLHTAQKEIRSLTESLSNAKRLGLYHGDIAALRPAEIRGAYHPVERYLSGVDWQKLIDALTPRKGDQDRRPHIIMYLHTGIRFSELFRICPEYVDLVAGTVRVEGTKTKASRRTIPLSATARAVVEKLLDGAEQGRPIFPAWDKHPAWQTLRHACQRAHLPALSFNDLRRSFASHMANSGIPEGVTADLLGHGSTDMVRRVYGRLSPATRQHAVDLLPGLAVADGVARTTRAIAPRVPPELPAIGKTA